MKKVLILASLYEGLFSTKYQRLSFDDKPFFVDLADYLIKYFFILDYTPEKDTKLQECIQGTSLSELSTRLKTEINSYNPDFILLHTGIVYSHAPKLLIDLLKGIKEIYVKISFGIEDRTQSARFGDSFFQLSDELQTLEAKNFSNGLVSKESSFKYNELLKTWIDAHAITNDSIINLDFLYEIAENSKEFIVESLKDALIQHDYYLQEVKGDFEKENFLRIGGHCHSATKIYGFLGCIILQFVYLKLEKDVQLNNKTIIESAILQIESFGIIFKNEVSSEIQKQLLS